MMLMDIQTGWGKAYKSLSPTQRTISNWEKLWVGKVILHREEQPKWSALKTYKGNIKWAKQIMFRNIYVYKYTYIYAGNNN